MQVNEAISSAFLTADAACGAETGKDI